MNIEEQPPAIIRVMTIDSRVADSKHLKQAFDQHPTFRLVRQSYIGDDGLLRVQQYKPDVILIGQSVYDMEDIAFLKQLMQTHPRTAPIMMSIINEPRWLHSALLLGCRHFAQKPIQPEYLYQTVQAAYDAYAQIRQRFIA